MKTTREPSGGTNPSNKRKAEYREPEGPRKSRRIAGETAELPAPISQNPRSKANKRPPAGSVPAHVKKFLALLASTIGMHKTVRRLTNAWNNAKANADRTMFAQNGLQDLQARLGALEREQDVHPAQLQMLRATFKQREQQYANLQKNIPGMTDAMRDLNTQHSESNSELYDYTDIPRDHAALKLLSNEFWTAYDRCISSDTICKSLKAQIHDEKQKQQQDRQEFTERIQQSLLQLGTDPNADPAASAVTPLRDTAEDGKERINLLGASSVKIETAKRALDKALDNRYSTEAHLNCLAEKAFIDAGLLEAEKDVKEVELQRRPKLDLSNTNVQNPPRPVTQQPAPMSAAPNNVNQQHQPMPVPRQPVPIGAALGNVHAQNPAMPAPRPFAQMSAAPQNQGLQNQTITVPRQSAAPNNGNAQHPAPPTVAELFQMAAPLRKGNVQNPAMFAPRQPMPRNATPNSDILQNPAMHMQMQHAALNNGPVNNSSIPLLRPPTQRSLATSAFDFNKRILADSVMTSKINAVRCWNKLIDTRRKELSDAGSMNSDAQGQERFRRTVQRTKELREADDEHRAALHQALKAGAISETASQRSHFRDREDDGYSDGSLAERGFPVPEGQAKRIRQWTWDEGQPVKPTAKDPEEGLWINDVESLRYGDDADVRDDERYNDLIVEHRKRCNELREAGQFEKAENDFHPKNAQNCDAGNQTGEIPMALDTERSSSRKRRRSFDGHDGETLDNIKRPKTKRAKSCS